MSAPNHTGLFLDELHHTLRGMLDGLAAMQVSPVSMLHCTLMASSVLPWFGSTQYSPTQWSQWSGCVRTWCCKHVADDLFCSCESEVLNTLSQMCHSSVELSWIFVCPTATGTHHSSSWGSTSSGRHRSWRDASCCHLGSSYCRSGCWGPSVWHGRWSPQELCLKSCCWAEPRLRWTQEEEEGQSRNPEGRLRYLPLPPWEVLGDQEVQGVQALLEGPVHLYSILFFCTGYWCVVNNFFNTVCCCLTNSENLISALCNKKIPQVQFLHWFHEFQEVPLVLAVRCILPFHEVQ